MLNGWFIVVVDTVSGAPVGRRSELAIGGSQLGA